MGNYFIFNEKFFLYEPHKFSFFAKKLYLCKMNQPLLYIIADHRLDISNRLSCKSLLENLPIGLELENYWLYAAHLTNEPPKVKERLLFQRVDDSGTLWFEVNGIDVKLAKNAIQLKFPVIFRSFFDYDYLRIAVYALLLKLLSTCKSTEFVVYPSFWEYYPHEVKNSWHHRRLMIAQKQICENCISYKRSKLHLSHCLSKEILGIKQMANRHYRGWYVRELNEI